MLLQSMATTPETRNEDADGRELHVVTGAFGFSGKYIARRLLDAGHRVMTLTNSPLRSNPFGGRVQARPFNFDDPGGLVDSLRGASVLYNTYWVRFNRAGFRFSAAVDNTLRLFEGAREAGVGRIVHVSITNPSEGSPFEYFRAKARVERALVDSGLPHSILRPALLFGREGILLNNIAWMLRRLPVFGVFGDGRYRLRPIHVDDFARCACAEGGATGKRVLDAVGPETFTYRDLVDAIGSSIGRRRPVVSVPPGLGLLCAGLLGKLLGDVVVTREEIGGLMADLLYVDSPPVGRTRLTDWVRENAAALGLRYAGELARREDRLRSYDELDGRRV